MAYEPTVWQTGDVVTAEKMNKLEQGVASGGSGGGGGVHMLEIDESSGTPTLNITFNEAVEFLRNGQILGFFKESTEESPVNGIITTYYDLGTSQEAIVEPGPDPDNKSDIVTWYVCRFCDSRNNYYFYGSKDPDTNIRRLSY